MKKVVVIGGGTGTYTVLQGLRDKKYELTALLTMVDDGGSNKVLRDEFGLLPTSGVRLAMVALSSKPSLLRELFLYRYHKGQGISGMTFGNLFLAAVTDIVGSQEKAIEQTAEILKVKGKVLPISHEDVRLVAQYENGLEVVGEHEIDEPAHDGKLKIVKLFTRPEANITEKARQAILEADAIILGPGDFYTNTVANLVVNGVVEALMESKANLIFMMNLMTKYGEAYNYTASTYLEDLKQYMPIERINTIIMNSKMTLPPETLEKYEEENSRPVLDDLASYDLPEQTTVIKAEVISSKEAEKEKGDVLKRSMVRHDPKRLARVLTQVIGE
ncbi:MAG TPA: gluconeogenesis factor YvcK family protein [Patescibacteria group bacterium]|nr:gluconeogenesis factor YvcK family protein [Patescibacteria group bacterium]